MDTAETSDEIGELAKEHPNDFTFKMLGITDAKFEITSHKITKDQPWSGLSEITCNDKGCKLIIKAGRQKSKEVANWFKDEVRGGAAIGCGSYDVLPGELNFACKGTFSFKHRNQWYSGQDLVLAQGRNARSRNNWWVGGPNMSQLVSLPIPHTAAAAQTFTVDAFPWMSKVFFSTILEQINDVDMGLIDL